MQPRDVKLAREWDCAVYKKYGDGKSKVYNHVYQVFVDKKKSKLGIISFVIFSMIYDLIHIISICLVIIGQRRSNLSIDTSIAPKSTSQYYIMNVYLQWQ